MRTMAQWLKDFEGQICETCIKGNNEHVTSWRVMLSVDGGDNFGIATKLAMKDQCYGACPSSLKSASRVTRILRQMLCVSTIFRFWQQTAPSSWDHGFNAVWLGAGSQHAMGMKKCSSNEMTYIAMKHLASYQAFCDIENQKQSLRRWKSWRVKRGFSNQLNHCKAYPSMQELKGSHLGSNAPKVIVLGVTFRRSSTNWVFIFQQSRVVHME